MLFATIKALGWLNTLPKPQASSPKPIQLEHVAFGSVLGSDRKMLRTRSGDSVKLKDLLQEAVERAEKLVRETEADEQRRRGFSEQDIRHIAETIGIASVKYADLCQNRNTDYVFSWDKMLALQGNTAPYMLYAYARIRSIYRKAIDSRPFDINVSDAHRLEQPADAFYCASLLPDHRRRRRQSPAQYALRDICSTSPAASCLSTSVAPSSGPDAQTYASDAWQLPRACPQYRSGSLGIPRFGTNVNLCRRVEWRMPSR
jgi:hypothetical protein